jgi:glycosyltransferase involved in cell wall biosynthesis
LNYHIAICIPCYNEASNIESLYLRLVKTLDEFPQDRFSIVFADNCSTDQTVELIEKLAIRDERIGLIRNISNFGFVRSSVNALLVPDADANVFLMSDLQDPPELISELIYAWKKGQDQVIFAVRRSSHESYILFLCKKLYYTFLSWLSDYPMVRDTTGFGIYDRSVILVLRESIDSYPFIKGLVCAIGFKWSTVPYVSDNRKGGRSSASISSLVDFGVLGIVTSSRKPMRMITIAGFSLGAISILLSLIVIITKIFFWQKFQFGVAMLSVSVLFFTGTIMFALGVLGEYIGFINQRTLRLPLVVEKSRHNVPSSISKTHVTS